MEIKGSTILLKLWNFPYKPAEDYNLLKHIETGKYTKIIVNAVQEFAVEDWNSMFGITAKRLEKALAEYNIELLIIYGTYGSCNKQVNEDPVVNTTVAYWPMFFLHEAYNVDINYDLEEDIPDAHIEKIGSMLNNRPRYHRCVTIDYLSKHNLLKHMHYSWHDNRDHANGETFKFKSFDNKVKKFKDDFNGDGMGENAPYEVFQSVLQILSESTINGYFYTEKTFNAIIRGRPFLNIGRPGSNKALENFGFKSYLEDFTKTNQFEQNWLKTHSNLTDDLFEEYVDRFIYALSHDIEKYIDTPKVLQQLLQEKIDYNRKRYREIVSSKLYGRPKAIDLFIRDTGFTPEELYLYVPGKIKLSPH